MQEDPDKPTRIEKMFAVFISLLWGILCCMLIFVTFMLITLKTDPVYNSGTGAGDKETVMTSGNWSVSFTAALVVGLAAFLIAYRRNKKKLSGKKKRLGR